MIKEETCKKCNKPKSEFGEWDSGSNGSHMCRDCGNKYRNEYRAKRRKDPKYVEALEVKRLKKYKIKCCRCRKTKSKLDFIRLCNAYTKICKVCYKKGKTQLKNIKYSSLGTTGNMVDDGYYLCSICNNIKPIISFYKDKKNKSGIKSTCKSCHKIRDREKKIRYNYNMTIEEFDRLYNFQNGICAICKTNLELGSNECCIDHDHNTGKVRGLLCNTCNRCLGMLKDNIQLLYSAIRYLKEPVHVKLGEFSENLETDNTEPS